MDDPADATSSGGAESVASLISTTCFQRVTSFFSSTSGLFEWAKEKRTAKLVAAAMDCGVRGSAEG